MRRIVLVGAESTYDDGTTLTGSDAISVTNFKIDYGADIHERDEMRDNISPVAPIIGKRYVTFSYDVWLKGSGSADTSAPFAEPLKACAITETVNAGVDIDYTLNSDSGSCVHWIYEPYSSSNSKIHKIDGCRGNVSFEFEAGKPAKASFTFRGLYSTPTDGSTVSPTYAGASVIEPVVENASFTWGGNSSLCVPKITIDLGNELVDIDDISTENALKEVRIVKRRPTGSFSCDAVSVATEDFYTDFINSTTNAIAFNFGSGTAENISISAPAVTIDAINEEELNGRRMEGIPFKLNQSSGNDEFQITVT